MQRVIHQEVQEEVYKDTSGRDEPCRSTPGSPSSARQSLVMNENQDTYFTPSVSVKTANKVSHDATTVQMSHSPVISPNAEAVGAWSMRVSGDAVVATPKRPVKVTQQPNEASPKVEVYRQLKSFNKPGLKEAKVDLKGQGLQGLGEAIQSLEGWWTSAGKGIHSNVM